jgi:hypothetical protein
VLDELAGSWRWCWEALLMWHAVLLPYYQQCGMADAPTIAGFVAAASSNSHFNVDAVHQL